QTTISFRSRIVNGRLRLTISDDGAALEKPKDTSAAAEQQGIGLLNVRSRLQSAYGEDFLFVSGPASPQGYFVEIEFPAHAVQTTHGTRAHSPSGI
ncbi:MAG TPA: hypothetical protein PKY73_14630, partial [Hyphomonas sp.]|nr:hypothetical protein [Hyphomonas sp.]